MKCPGQDTRFWKPGDIFEVPCPVCGHLVEFFKDEGVRKCPNCGYKFKNPKIDLSCLEWCPYAKQCLGSLPEGKEQMEQILLTNQLIDEMKKVFQGDQKRIKHTLQVLEYAKELVQQEEANPRVVLASAILHDIGIKEAERKYGSSAGKYQEIEGPPIARKILDKTELDEQSKEHILKIIANHHSARDIDTPEFRILWDADWLVNLAEEKPNLKGDELRNFIERTFKTKAGKKKAYELFLKETQPSK